MKKTRRNLRKVSRRHRRMTHHNKKHRKSKNLKMRRGKKSRRQSRRTRRIRGGGNLIPQDLVNTWRAGEDNFHKMYKDWTGTQRSWSNSNPSHQPDLLVDKPYYPKLSNIQELNENADLKINNLLGADGGGVV